MKAKVKDTMSRQKKKIFQFLIIHWNRRNFITNRNKE